MSTPPVQPKNKRPEVHDGRSGTETRYEECSLSHHKLEGIERAAKKPIGTGAYGEVIQFKFKGLLCAGKKLHDVFFDNVSSEEKATILQRFETECTMLSTLRHPNIVQFLGVYYKEDYAVPILVMEYLPSTLTQCVERFGVLPEEISYSILQDVALGLCYLHGHSPSIIHRDLTANNVLLTSDMRAKISDLGVARILNLSHAQKTQVHLTRAPGTPAYMPPEALVKNPKYTTKIDIFSFGILILHLFTAKWPLAVCEAVALDPSNPDKMIPLSEAERRQEYLQEMGVEHPLIELVCQCIHNNQARRPDATAILAVIEEKRCLIPPTSENKVQLIQWIQHYKQVVEQLKTTITSLEAENQTLNTLVAAGVEKPFAERSDTASLNSDSSHRSHEVLTPRLSISSTASSNASVHVPSHHSFSEDVPHPCQPGAKFTWSKTCADLPTAMYYAQAVTIGDAVYAGGGCTKDQDTIVFRYDLTQDRWNSLPPCSVSFFGLAKCNSKLMVLGGITSNKSISNAVYSFDEEMQQWNDSIPPMLMARYSLAVLSFQSNIIACGGKNATGVTSSVEVFKADSSQWFQTHPLPFPCYQMSSTIIHGCCYLLGGFDQFAFTDKVPFASLSALFETTCASAPNSKTKVRSPWHLLHSLRHNCAAAANVGGCLLAIGGVRAVGSAKVCIYSQLQKSWVKLADLGHSSCLGFAVAELPNGEILVIGGATSNFCSKTAVHKGSIFY